HSMRNIRETSAYLGKYLLKDADQRSENDKKNNHERIEMDGKIWDCSLLLKKEKYFSCEKDTHFEDALYEKMKRNEVIKINSDFAIILIIKKGLPGKTLLFYQSVEFENWKKRLWQMSLDSDYYSKAA